MSPVSPATWTRGLLDRAAVGPGALTLLGTGLVDATGTGLYLAGSAVFFNMVIGLSPAQVGFGLSSAGLLGLLAAPSLGWCADRWGARRVLVLLHVWRALAFALLSVAPGFGWFLVATSMIGVGQQALSPVYQALVEELLGSRARLAMMARSRVVYNVGFSLGGVLATVVIGLGSRTGFTVMILGNAGCCLATALLLMRLRVPRRSPSQDHASPSQDHATSRSPFHLRSLRDGRYLAVAALNGVLSLHISILSIGLPLWVTLHTSAPRALAGLLLVINTIMAVVLQVPASGGADTIDGGTRALARGGYALSLCCLVLALSPHVSSGALAAGLLVLAVVVLTGSEIWQSAGGWGLSYALATQTNRAESLSTFNLGISGQYVLGPALITVGVLDHGVLGWLGLALVFAATAAAVPGAVARAARRPALHPGTPVPDSPDPRTAPEPLTAKESRTVQESE
ncbi:MAG: hypothetical protein QG608_3222 [Actinomycetota bacterium]|nr:hypothetical protein [Actinomycetota bacterium]